jgi:RNA polymerase sigma factor (sigma-70 family)
MNTLMGWIEKYRQETDLDMRLNYATSIYMEIVGDLSLFAFGKVHAFAAEDVLSETFAAIFTRLSTFRGKSDKEFLGWCYRIARNKISDHYRKKSSDRLEPFPSEELWYLIENYSQEGQDWKLEKADLHEALNLLEKSKPGCREYLWNHYVLGFDYSEIAEESRLKYDAVRRRIERCLEAARDLLK